MQKKPLVPLLAILLVLGGCAGYLLFFKDIGVPGKLYQYYPASTGFYVELSPGENMTRRFIAFLDETVSEQERQTGLRKEPKRNTSSTHPLGIQKGLKPHLLSTLATKVTVKDSSLKASGTERNEVKNSFADTNSTISRAKSLVEQDGKKPDKRKSFRRVFIQKFNSTFKPDFSLGIWPDAQKPHNEETAHILVVFPLKDEQITLTELIQRFDVTMDDFHQENYGLNKTQIPFIIEKTSKTSLALLDKRLLITKSPETMRAVLGHYLQKMPNVYENPLNEKYLAKLPKNRQGTFILNNTVYGANTLSKPIGHQFRQVSQVMPLTVGSVHVKSDTFISTRFLTPVLLDQITDTAVRESLQAVYQATDTFNPGPTLPKDTTFFVGIAGLDKFYDLYTSHILPPRNLQTLKGIDFFLTNFKLDLRRDIVSLLEEGTVIATRPAKQSLIVMLKNNQAKQAALNKVSAVLATGKLPLRLTTQQLENTSIHTLTIPDKRKSKVDYTLLGSTITFAPSSDFKALLEVKKGRMKSLQQSHRYKSLMSNLPQRGSLVMYADLLQQAQLLERQLQAHGRHLNQKLWLEGMSLALWSTKSKHQDVDVIEGQLNLQLIPYKLPIN